ncbi:MAG: hypothetical protein ACK53L_02820, partial [Pirellulaceae bacterium]
FRVDFERGQLLQSQREVQIAVAVVGGPTATASVPMRILFDANKGEDVLAEAGLDLPHRYVAASDILPGPSVTITLSNCQRGKQ